MKSIVLNLSTNAAGAGTARAAAVPPGLLYALRLVDGTFDDGVDLVLTAEQDGLSIPLYTGTDFNTDKVVYPRIPETSAIDGSALGSAAMPLVVGEPKAVIAQGGNAKSGSLILYILD